MDKKQAIKILINSAKLYKENLEGKNVLFIYGLPSEVKNNNNLLENLNYYESSFGRKNYLHLTGVKINVDSVKSATQFYERCINNKLSSEDIIFSNNEYLLAKLEVLERMMLLKDCANMIGDFSGKGPYLYTEKMAGNTCACIGFVKDATTQLNVPNTLIRSDIRDVVRKPVSKIYAIASKNFNEELYKTWHRVDKSIDIKYMSFPDEIEKKIIRV